VQLSLSFVINADDITSGKLLTLPDRRTVDE
jgi:hypothetical protein